MSQQLPAGIGAADDAIALVRAYLAGDQAEADRILAQTSDQRALSANLAAVAYYTLHQLSGDLREQILADARSHLLDNALDVYLEISRDQ